MTHRSNSRDIKNFIDGIKAAIDILNTIEGKTPASANINRFLATDLLSQHIALINFVSEEQRLRQP